MKKNTLIGTLILAMSLLGSASHATLLELNATSAPVNPNFVAESFTITFNDTGDGLLQIDEILSFSGARFYFVLDPTLDQTGDAILGVANIAGISSGSGDDTWDFQNSGGSLFPALPIGDQWGAATRYWTYATQTVPGPGALYLLIFGLLALARRH